VPPLCGSTISRTTIAVQANGPRAQPPHPETRRQNPRPAAGALVLAWIAVQVAIIGYVSWMQPATTVAGILVLALARCLPRGR
jgi:hypothetical protein